MMRVEKQIKVLLCFSSASNLVFKIYYELNNCYLVLVVQIITAFHNRWIDYYKSVWLKETFITLMLKVARQYKFHLYMTLPFKSYWKQNMKEIPY
jgi:hypothetical protein